MRKSAFKPDTPIVLAAGLRTPWAKAGGRFAREDAGHLGSLVTRELMARHDLDPECFDELIAGSVGPPHDQANIARVIALRAGLPEAMPARTVARNCASGIEAVTTAMTSILAGQADCIMAVGVEVMSAYPLIYGSRMTQFFARMMRARSLGQKLGNLTTFRPKDLAPRVALTEGLTDPTVGMIMGSTAELIARDFDVTRQQCDEFASQSHNRAEAARDRGRFEREILPVLPLHAKEGEQSLRHDDGIRDNQTPAGMAKLKPYFEKPDGVVTVGNACGISDGASALVVCTEAKARDLGLEPLATLEAWAWAGLDPSRMGLGPVFSTSSVLDASGYDFEEFDVIEINEAFAAQVLACERAFASREFAEEKLGRSTAVGELDWGRTNVNGGAIPLGHPVGATGARLLLTVAHELIEQDKELGLATLCIGGGQGGAVVLRRAR